MAAPTALPMTSPTIPPSRFRFLWAALALVLFSLAVGAFFDYGSDSTDENLFTTPPSAVYLAAGVPAAGGEMLPAGAFVTRIDRNDVKTMADWTAAVSGGAGGVRTVVYAPDTQRFARREVRVDGAALKAARVVDAATFALVIDVTRGGASDRAGMKVGDVIARIDGRAFGNVQEADALMRRGGVGRAYDYEVLRQGTSVTLPVTLARFGVQLFVLVWFLAGLLWMTFGTWLLWVRSQLVAARLLGLAFLLIGYGVSVIALPQQVRANWGPVLGAIIPANALLIGLAMVGHASVLYPREWPRLSKARWFRWTLYGLVAVGNLAFVLAGNNFTIAAMLAGIAAFPGLVRLWRRDERPADYKAMQRPLKAAGAAALTTAVLLLVLGALRQGTPPTWLLVPQALALTAAPLAHFYTIGRYRLFDLQLRLRRNVQYSLVSFAWAVIPFLVLLWLLWTLPQLDLPIPDVRLTSSSVEVMDSATPSPDGNPLEKGVLMVVAILLAFGLREVALRGLRVLAARYHRGRYDYRRAAQMIGEVTSTRLDLDGITAGVLEALVTLLPMKRAGMVFVHGRRVHCPPRAHGVADEEWQAFCQAWAPDLVDVMANARGEMSADYAPPRLGDALRGAAFEFIYPLRSRDVLVGVLFAGEKQSESAYQSADFEFLAAMASQIAGDVENAFLYQELAEQERLRHELEIARQIQLASLPQFTPDVCGLDVSGISIPAHEVGGDYFDYLNENGHRLTVMVGDVSGKGTSAALYMSRLQGIVRSLHAFKLSPRELFVRTNQLISRDLERRSFVTAIGAFFDTERRLMVLARAGHLPLYHYRHEAAAIDAVLPRGLGFGLSTRGVFEAELEEQTIRYAPGDVFLFVTDGITECQNAEGELFGEERLLPLLQEEARRQPTAAGLRDAVTAALRDFAGDADPFDDQTVVVVRVVETAGSETSRVGTPL